MAPRRGGRPKKPGLQRIDAAFDALIPLGFSKDVVRKTIRNLLKVYGGDEGWVFIEEASYKLVIDAILEHQQEEEKQKPKQKQKQNMEIEGDVDTSRALEISEPVVDAGVVSMHPDVVADGLHSGELALTSGEGAGHENEFPATAEDASPSILPSAALAGDASQSKLPVMARDANQTSLQQPDDVARQRRPPCYGWISESESEEEA